MDLSHSSPRVPSAPLGLELASPHPCCHTGPRPPTHRLLPVRPNDHPWPRLNILQYSLSSQNEALPPEPVAFRAPECRPSQPSRWQEGPSPKWAPPCPPNTSGLLGQHGAVRRDRRGSEGGSVASRADSPTARLSPGCCVHCPEVLGWASRRGLPPDLALWALRDLHPPGAGAFFCWP